MKSFGSLADLVVDPMPRVRQPLKAYCKSQPCCRYEVEEGKTKYRFHPFVERPLAKKGAIDCPACGHALFWTRDPEQAAS